MVLFLQFIPRTGHILFSAIFLTSVMLQCGGLCGWVFAWWSHTFNRLISQILEAPALQNIHPCWLLIAFHLFSSKLSFLSVSAQKNTKRNCFFLILLYQRSLNHNVGLTVSCRSVLRVQDAWFLERSDAGVHQLQACRQLLLYVLLSICMCTNQIGEHMSRNKDAPSSSTLLHCSAGHKPHTWLD